MPEVADEGVRLLQEMDFHGVSHVEFKRDPRDGRFKLMEINARLYGTHSLAAACGVNLSAAAYYDAIGRPFHAPLQREGVRWLAMNRDLVASPRQILHGDLSIGEWVATLRGVRVDGALSLDDPLPGVAVLLATANRVLRRSVQVVRQRSL
jgi:predicted ATP-grasp superfamily ATP-dependent carboligase